MTGNNFTEPPTFPAKFSTMKLLLYKIYYLSGTSVKVLRYIVPEIGDDPNKSKTLL